MTLKLQFHMLEINIECEENNCSNQSIGNGFNQLAVQHLISFVSSYIVHKHLEVMESNLKYSATESFISH